MQYERKAEKVEVMVAIGDGIVKNGEFPLDYREGDRVVKYEDGTFEIYDDIREFERKFQLADVAPERKKPGRKPQPKVAPVEPNGQAPVAQLHS